MYEKSAVFRFYEELNDFLPKNKRKQNFLYCFKGRQSVKTVVEAMGVPHCDIDLILVNGESVGFDCILENDDRVAVYPVFEALDIGPIVRLRAKPLRITRFVLDVHLGKLARRLRLLGFDSLYRNDYEDEEIVEIAKKERRIILTRDIEMLKHGDVSHGYWLRSTHSQEQIREVVKRFDLKSQFKPFSRCLKCNGFLQKACKDNCRVLVPSRVFQVFDDFFQCDSCKQLFWRGSHYQKMEKWLDELC